MRGTRTAILTVVVVVIGVAGIWVAMQEAPADTAPSVSARVTTLAPKVSLRRGDTESFAVVPDTATATVSSAIRTELDGRALVELATSSKATVDGGTIMEISELVPAQHRSTLRLIAGQVWSRLEKTLEQGEYYSIKTRNGVATVRGTSFNVAYAFATTTVTVADGMVSVVRRDPDTGRVQESTRRDVSAGQTAWIGTSTDGVRVSGTPRSIRRSDWYRGHTPDQQAAATTSSEQPARQDDTPHDTRTHSTQEPTGEQTSATTPEGGSESISSGGGTTPSFGVTEMSTTSVELSSAEETTITLVGHQLDDTRTVFIGDFAVDAYTKINASTLEVTVPYEIPDGSHRIIVQGASDDQIGAGPSELTVRHASPEENDRQLRG